MCIFSLSLQILRNLGLSNMKMVILLKRAMTTLTQRGNIIILKTENVHYVLSYEIVGMKFIHYCM